MLENIFSAFGSLFASGPGLLILAALAGLIPLVWDWRVTVAALVTLHVAVTLMLAHLHGTPALLTVSQLVATLVTGSLLALAQWVRRAEPPSRQPANWLVRSMAVGFVVLAWWFVDPGIGLPMMSQPEVDILVWMAVCALIVMTLTVDPLFAGAALLLWLLPAYAFSIVLLPTTGMPALLGITEILVALACGYLILTQPRRLTTGGARRIVVPLPQVRPAQPLRFPALRPRTIAAAMRAPAAQPQSANRVAPLEQPASQPPAEGFQ